MNYLQRISDHLAQLDKHPRRCMWGCVAFTIIYYLLISLQGVDFADEGFSLTFYQNIYTHPYDVEYLFLYYLTGIIGGIWEMIFAPLGTYGYRILFAVTSGAIVLTLFATLKPYIKTSTLTLGAIACTIWPGLCLYYFNHDCLTILLFLLTIYSMMKGLDGKRWAWYAMGVFLVLNTSTRLPNVLLCILIFIPLVEAGFSGNYTQAMGNMLRIAGGMIITSAIWIVAMLLLDHLGIYFSALGSLFIMSEDSSDTHSIKNLLITYSYTYKAILTSTFYGIAVYFIYAISTQYIKIKNIKLIAGIVCCAIIYSLLIRNIYAMWGCLTAASILYTFLHRHNSQLFILGIASLVMLVVIPLGGDSYRNICHSCMWLGMPIFITLLRQPLKWHISLTNDEHYKYGITIDNASREVEIILTVAFLIFSATHSVCYFDNGSRWEKNTRPQVEKVTTYTSHQRAELIESIVNTTLAHRSEGNYLLVFDNAPMLHYLTGMQPYLGSPWGTFWGKDMFTRRLTQAENYNLQLPLIAIPQFYYQDLSATNYLDPIQHPEMIEKIEALYSFMQRHSYIEVHRDNYIILYKPAH